MKIKRDVELIRREKVIVVRYDRDRGVYYNGRTTYKSLDDVTRWGRSHGYSTEGNT